MHSQAMRRFAVVLVASVLTVGVFSAADVLSQLGVNAAAAKEAVMSDLGSGWLDYDLAAPAFRKAPVALRVQLVEGAIAWAKAYTASAEFKTAYATLRENRKPDAPAFQGTPEEEFARQRAQQAKDQAKATEEMKQALASMAADVRKQVEDAMKAAAAVAQQMDTPEMRKMMLDGIRMEREGKTREYQDDLKKWQAEYPENPAPVIAKRLKAFLDTSAGVDFDAKLEKKDGQMRFVNASYESKPSEWKLWYRAGKEPVAAARVAVGAWLKELGR